MSTGWTVTFLIFFINQHESAYYTLVSTNDYYETEKECTDTGEYLTSMDISSQSYIYDLCSWNGKYKVSYLEYQSIIYNILH